MPLRFSFSPHHHYRATTLKVDNTVQAWVGRVVAGTAEPYMTAADRTALIRLMRAEGNRGGAGGQEITPNDEL
jgi:hypothetical protein